MHVKNHCLIWECAADPPLPLSIPPFASGRRNFVLDSALSIAVGFEEEGLKGQNKNTRQQQNFLHLTSGHHWFDTVIPQGRFILAKDSAVSHCSSHTAALHWETLRTST